MNTANEIIKHLELEPHPERGYYRRTYKSSFGEEARAYTSAIYYLLEGGRFARLHRMDSDELWLWHGGAPLTLEVNAHEQPVKTLLLGNDLLKNETPQILVPANHWQRARSEGDWTLVSCVVSPEFTFESYEII
ncbi:MAG: cupin [Kordiimonadales bacterium]|nr:MAG: cupin [Kordiimonadales bacterium]